MKSITIKEAKNKIDFYERLLSEFNLSDEIKNQLYGELDYLYELIDMNDLYSTNTNC